MSADALGFAIDGVAIGGVATGGVVTGGFAVVMANGATCGVGYTARERPLTVCTLPNDAAREYFIRWTTPLRTLARNASGVGLRAGVSAARRSFMAAASGTW